MSFINVSITNRNVPGPVAGIPSSSTIRAGFNREGGRLESLEKVTANRGPLPPRTHRLLPDADLSTAADGLLRAAQGADWVQDVVVDHRGAEQPALVTWTHRHGRTGSALETALPTGVQAVLDAAAALDAAISDKLAVRILPA